jgi:lincosamide nucleotidyltransferase A/C/D/E
MTEHAMPAETARGLLAAMQDHGVAVSVGGGWAVDALLGRETRPHSDLDVWVEAADCEGLFASLVDQGVDRLYPYPGDRPWNFVLHDGHSRRMDLHLYEDVGDGRLQYGSVQGPFDFTVGDLSGEGVIAGLSVRCERADFALRNHTGYEIRDRDRDDVAALCEHFGFALPDGYRPR